LRFNAGEFMRRIGITFVCLLVWTALVAGVTWNLARMDQPTRPTTARAAAPNDAGANVAPAGTRNDAPIVIIRPDPPAPKPQRETVPKPALEEPVPEEIEEEILDDEEPVPEEPPAPVTPPPATFGALTVNRDEKTSVAAGAGLDSVYVAAGGTLSLPAGEVTVRGNLTGPGSVAGGRNSTLILDGNQEIGASLMVGTAILRGGTKRLTSKAASRNGHTHAAPGQANLIIEPGTTLIIEEGGAWDSSDAYAYQVGGTLILDGGTFQCTFANNSQQFNDCWLPGSSLIIRRGRFVGSGDHDFSGASITILDGSLEIDDDIWHSGDRLEISGGLMRNSTGGGMFSLTGTVRMTGGRLVAYQSHNRGLFLNPETSVFCTGGDVEIRGSNATHDASGILVYNAPVFSRLVCHASTRIHNASPQGSSLTIGELVIARGQTFEARGYPVSAPLPDPDGGRYVP
jgi:hypothetical protein